MAQIFWAGLLGAFVLFLLSLRKKRAIPDQVKPFDQNHNSPYWRKLRYYISAQADHETGGFTSRLALDQNNVTGMNIPKQRPFVGFKDSGPYMRYKDWNQSIEDLLLWMNYTGFPVYVADSRQYVQELKKRGYFEDTEQNYIAGVNNALRKLPASTLFKIGL
jgi:hypothetical protein